MRIDPVENSGHSDREQACVIVVNIGEYPRWNLAATGAEVKP